MGGDRLIYSGQIDEILELKRTHGLVNAPHHVFSLKDIERGRKLRTATVSHESTLVGKNFGSITFEQEHGIALVAVSRMGQRIEGSPRDVVLAEGDTLLLECSSSQRMVEKATSHASV